MTTPTDEAKNAFLSNYGTNDEPIENIHSKCGRFCYLSRGGRMSPCVKVPLYAAFGFIFGGLVVSIISLAVARVFFIGDSKLSVSLALKILIPSCTIPGIISGVVGYRYG